MTKIHTTYKRKENAPLPRAVRRHGVMVKKGQSYLARTHSEVSPPSLSVRLNGQNIHSV